MASERGTTRSERPKFVAQPRQEDGLQDVIIEEVGKRPYCG